MKEGTTPSNTTNIQLKVVLSLITTIVIWAGLGLVLCYRKDFFGNRQELYPTIILPGFGRNKDKTSRYVYNKYQVKALNKDSARVKLDPKKLFGQHWISKINTLIEDLKSDTLKMEVLRKEQLPHGTFKIEVVRQQCSYIDKVAVENHPVIDEEIRTYYVQ